MKKDRTSLIRGVSLILYAVLMGGGLYYLHILDGSIRSPRHDSLISSTIIPICFTLAVSSILFSVVLIVCEKGWFRLIAAVIHGVFLFHILGILYSLPSVYRNATSPLNINDLPISRQGHIFLTHVGMLGQFIMTYIVALALYYGVKTIILYVNVLCQNLMKRLVTVPNIVTSIGRLKAALYAAFQRLFP